MMNWFGLGDTTPAAEGGGGRQAASLIDHDVMEKTTKKKKGKKSSKTADREGSSAADKKKKKSSSKKSTGLTMEAQANADAAEDVADQMKSAASWWLDEGDKKKAAKKEDEMKANMNWWEASNPDADIDEITGLNLDVEDEFKPIDDFEGAELTFDILSNLRDREAPGYDPMDIGAVSATGGEDRTKQMRDAMDWWSRAYHDMEGIEADPSILAASAEDMQMILQWWADKGKLYKGPSGDDKKALASKELLSKWGDDSLSDKDKAKELQKALSWWMEHKDEYEREMKDLGNKIDQFRKMDHFFDWYEAREGQTVEKPEFDPASEPSEAERLANELELKMNALLNSDFDGLKSDLQLGGIDPFKKVKQCMGEWVFRFGPAPTTAAGQLEEALDWYRKNGSVYDPETASELEKSMYKKVQQCFLSWGFKDPSNQFDSEKLAKEMKDALKFWKRNKDVEESDLDPFEAERMMKIKHAMLQIRNDPFASAAEARKVQEDIDGVLGWWKRDGKGFDPDKASLDDLKMYEKLKLLMSDWNDDGSMDQDRATADIMGTMS